MNLAAKLRIRLYALTLALLVTACGVMWVLLGLQNLADVAHEEFDELRHVQQAHEHLDRATVLVSRRNYDAALTKLRSATREIKKFEHSQVSEPSALGAQHALRERESVDAMLGYIGDAQDALLIAAESTELGGGHIDAVVEGIGMAMTTVVLLASELEAVVSEVQDTTIDRLRVTAWVLGGLFLAGFVGAIVFNISHYRSIIRPLRYLRDGVRRLASGDMSIRLEQEADREFAQLQSDFNHMASELESLYRELEQRVAARSKELAVAERRASVGYLAAGVAHEVNNPLGIISGHAESLLRRIRPHASRDPEVAGVIEGLGIIRDEAFRCKGITQGLLDLSHLGDDHRGPVSLRQVVDDVVQLVGASPAGRDRRIEFQARSDDALIVKGSVPELTQVALNLTINALQSVPQGSGHVALDARRTNDSVELHVRDNGCGMDAQTMERVFEPFYTRGKGIGGVGLGLSISQAIAERHGGLIIATSAGLGSGSVFTLRLPAVERGA